MSSHAVNYTAWNDPEIVASHRDNSWIAVSEKVVLARLKEKRRGGKILDIGVGAGRLTPSILEVSKDYLGVDYSQGMIDLCRLKFPGVAFERADARDLGAHADGAFDLAVFSFNGLDYASHEDRRKILNEIARVLKPGGDFVFSTHNRSMKDFDKLPVPFPSLRRPLGFLPGLARLAAGLLRHRRHRREEIRGEGYAIINEPEFFYSFMRYYVTIGEQTRQLRAAGFSGAIEVFAQDGRVVAEDTTSRALYFWAVK